MVQSIILRKQAWGEADELVGFLTRDLGWLAGVAKNSRKSRVRFGGHLEPLTLVDLTIRPRKKDTLVWIDDSNLVKGFTRVRSELLKVSWCSYFLELSSLLLPEASPEPEVFDFLLSFHDLLDTSDPGKFRLLLEEIRLLGLLGYGPQFYICPACATGLDPGQDALFSPATGGVCHLSCVDLDRERSVSISPDTLAAVRKGLESGARVVDRLRLGNKGLGELRRALSALVRHLRGADINSLTFLEKMGSW